MNYNTNELKFTGFPERENGLVFIAIGFLVSSSLAWHIEYNYT